MEELIKNRFNSRILTQATDRFGIAADQIALLDGFESFIYQFQKEGQEYILRISHSQRRSADLIRGELDWINYLADGGVGVSRAVPSQSGEMVEVVDDQHGGEFLAAAFEKARGQMAWKAGVYEKQHLYAPYGRLIGRMHRLTKSYQPADPAWKRLEWDDPLNIDTKQWLLPASENVFQRQQALIASLRRLPKDIDSYGLVHLDAHAGNFFLDDQNQFTLFDFDDCTYSWFANDLAMVLFYAVTNREDMEAYAARFWPRFLEGYHQENSLDPSWLRHVPDFLKLREIDIFTLLHRSRDVSKLNPEGWDGRFMRGRRERLEQGLPYLEMSF